jgi:putative ABC transport system permease protein
VIVSFHGLGTRIAKDLREQTIRMLRLPDSVAHQRSFRLSASFWEATRIAVDSLRKNKLRSFLTLLGIILATTTLISVTALIHGMNIYIAEKVSNMGSDGFRIVRMAWFGPWDPKKFFEMDKKNPQIRPDEYDFLRGRATLLKEVGMTASRNGRVAYKGTSQESVNIQGISENIPTINNVQVGIGRGITYEEVRRHTAVAFIGTDLRDRFFEGVDPLGKSVSVEGRPYEVVGVAKTLGSVFGNSQDNFVMIPIESYFKTYGSRNGIRLLAKAIDQEHLAQAQDEARVLIRSYRHLLPGQDDNFSLFASDTIVSLWETLTATIAAMAVGIVSVFMVVGGIVIMNIMLAVVTERTHEIGIRKSLGARKRDILNQYLVESAVLSGSGGFVGVCLAWGVAILVRNLTSVPMALPWTSVAIGVGLSATVGLFFGIYPAQKAAKLDPIEALRAEK